MRTPAAPRPAAGLPVALSVAGSDSGGGAGIQADLLTFSAHGVYGTTAITCLTAQNPDGVSAVHAAPVSIVHEQIVQVERYFHPRAAKTGMLFNAEIVETVAAFFERHPRMALVVDPVMVATSGATLLRQDAIEAMTRRLFPAATVITPNLDEAAVLLGRRPERADDLADAALELAARFGTAVLLKGGHLRGRELEDVLATAQGGISRYRGDRIHSVDTHGSGCTLSAAIAANLAHGLPLRESVARARRYLRGAMRRPVKVGRRRFIAH